jgi:thioredoxin-like negative regulator of GroEL
MGFFSKAPDPIEKLKVELESKPTDSRLLLELAGLLKAKGAVSEAADHYLNAALALADKGFAPKAVAIVKQVTQLTPKSVEAFELLAKLYEQMKVKEDLRTVLKQLIPLYRAEGKESSAKATEAKIQSLGPGR